MYVKYSTEMFWPKCDIYHKSRAKFVIIVLGISLVQWFFDQPAGAAEIPLSPKGDIIALESGKSMRSIFSQVRFYLYAISDHVYGLRYPFISCVGI